MKNLNLNKIFPNGKWLNFSNALTAVRIFSAPIIIWGMYKSFWTFSFFVFVIGAVTDFFDGYLARLLHEQTNLGRILDPIADKIFLISSFFSLSFINSPSFYVPTWFVVLIIVREFLIVLGSFSLLCFCKNFEVKPVWWGKMTTFFQILFIGWIFVCYFFSWIPIKTYKILLFLVSIYSVISFFAYLKIALNQLILNVYE